MAWAGPVLSFASASAVADPAIAAAARAIGNILVVLRSFMVAPIRVWRNVFTIFSEVQAAVSQLGKNPITTARSAIRAQRLCGAASLDLVVRRQERQVHLLDRITLGFPDARLGNQVRDVESLADALRGRSDATVELL